MTHRISVAFGFVAGVAASTALAQMTMPDKWDRKCPDDAGKNYISCMANAGNSETAMQQCQEQKVNDEKKCKK